MGNKWMKKATKTNNNTTNANSMNMVIDAFHIHVINLIN